MRIYVCIYAEDSVPKTLVRMLHSAVEDNVSPFDSKTACLCQNIKNNNIKHVYRQSQVQKPTGNGVKWAECSLIIGDRLSNLSLYLDPR